MTGGEPIGPASGLNPKLARALALGLFAVALVAFVTYQLLKPPPTPPPAAIAGDPLLVEGRERYLARCAACHGETGKGEGAIAKKLPGPPVGDLTDATWKHGDKPEEVVNVIAVGVPNSAMAGWKGALGDTGVRAVAAYVFYLAGRAVPPELREP